jgi:hypothetical protein
MKKTLIFLSFVSLIAVFLWFTIQPKSNNPIEWIRGETTDYQEVAFNPDQSQHQSAVMGQSVPVVNQVGLPNFGFVKKGIFSRSGQPDAFGFKHLKKAGVTIILKLDTDQEYSNDLEQQQWGGKIKFGYVSMDHTVDPNYCQEGQKLAKWVNKQINAGEWVHIHCHLGRDRVGLVVGTWMIRYGGKTLNQVKKTWQRYGVPFQAYQDCLKNVVPLN